MRSLPVFVSACMLVVALPVTAAERPHGPVIDEIVRDDQGRVVWEFGHDSGRAEMSFATHYFHVDKVRPGGGGSLTDCTSTAYRLAPWRWTGPYSATSSAYVEEMAAAAATWDAATSASIVGSITFGANHTAGVQDYHNQFDFASLGASTTIAVTTTWYNTFTGVAIESDAKYNTYYSWSTTGLAGSMDVLNIATHEIGHTLGLDHPSGKPGKIACLTMYAYGSEGEVAKRSLGDGDILGIRAKYGA